MKAFDDLRRVFTRSKFVALCGAFFFSLACAPVGAVQIPDRVTGAFDAMLTRQAGQNLWELSLGGGVGTLATAGDVAAISTDGGLPSVTRTAQVLNPAGVKVPMSVAARVPGAAAASLLVKGLKLAPVLGTGIALYEMAQEVGFSLSKTADGVQVQKAPTGACTTAPCYEYQNQYTGDGLWYSTLDAACKSYLGQSLYGSPTTSAIAAPPNSCVFSNGSDTRTFGLATPREVAPATGGQASTLDALRDAIAAKSGWPSGSSVSQALVDAQNLTGEKIQTQNPILSGPATSTGKSSTTANPDGSTTTKTTNYGHTYSGNTYTTNVVNVTSNYSPTTNTTTTTTETTTPDPAQSDCEKNPNALGCQTLNDVPDDQVPKKTETLTYEVEDLGFGAGQCPASQTVTTHIGSVTLNMSPYCDALVTYCKPVLILLALLTAFFIVAPVKTDA